MKKAVISDGYHTMGELYEHRTYLFSLICYMFKSVAWISDKHSDGTMFEGMFIAGVTTPEGDYTYHCENEYKPMFASIKKVEFAPKWDGHKPCDYKKLDSLFIKNRLKEQE